MEIITYVRKGAITHQHNLGNRGRTEAGDVQVMSAGTGVSHNEMNEEGEVTQIFQIWIMPEALPIRTDARLVAATLEAAKSAEYRIAAKRKAYLVLATGQVTINGVGAKAGDGVAISDERLLQVNAEEDSEIVLVDVA